MRVIVIGGNPAGLSAASAIRKSHTDWRIDVFEKGQYVSYGSCGIPYYVADEVKNLDNLITLTKEKLKQKRDIQVHLFHEVVGVNFNRKTVQIKNIKNDEEFEKEYDYLVIATGGETKDFPNVEMNHPRIFKIHTLGHAKQLKTFLRKNKTNSVIIIGAGYIGLEMLESYEAHGVNDVTIIGPRLVYSSQSQEYVKKELEKHHIKILNQNRVQSITPISDKCIRVILKNGQTLEADIIQVSIGVKPATRIFEKTGLKMLSNGAIVTDEFMQTNINNVYAAGDCVASYHQILKKMTYIPLAPAANKQGRIAGLHIAGKTVDPFSGTVGTSIFKVFDLYCSKTGITEEQAKELGFNVQKVLIENNEIAHYYPSAKKMSVLLIFDSENHLLLGAEITAPSPMGAKKNDVLATALAAKMRIDDIQKLDLSYAPPFAPVWDPILIAANIARKKCE